MKARLRACRDSGIEAWENWGIEDRLIPAIRIFVALLALFVALIHPAQATFLSPVVGAVPTLYVLYSCWLYVRRRRDDRIAASLKTWVHWIDVGWSLALVCLHRGDESMFFTWFLFPIMVASFRLGFASGLRVTLISVLLFATVSAVPAPDLGPRVDPTLIFLRCVWLLALGFSVAYWGQSEITRRRRLGLINEISGHSNPRFGIDRTVAFILEQLKEFYGARSSLLVIADTDGREFQVQRTGASEAETTTQFRPIAPELAKRLLELSPEVAAVYNAKHEGWWRPGRCDHLLDITIGRTTKVERSTLAGPATMLDARAFVTVPVQFRGVGTGRLYVCADSPVFVVSDMHFLLRVLDHVNPIVENIRLVEQLSSHAADEERRKIARDIHDSVIQPYVGLQLGLAAIREKIAEHSPQVSRQVELLMELAGSEVEDLRSYVTGLKSHEESDGGLLPAMRRFTAKFSEATGIAVEIETEGDIHANAQLAGEAFQMITEGLSNIRKHTDAVRANLLVACRAGHLILKITSENSRPATAPFFTPASITERAAALGGKVRVVTAAGGGFSVVVDIPL